MARATFVKSARKPIYLIGKREEYVSKKGKREGQTLSKVDRSQPKDETDKILVNKGESYYWWEFKNGPTHISKERPRASQLTQSSFKSQYYSIQERIEDFQPTEPDEIESFVEDLKSDIESLKDECQESLDNMPEHLQESSSSGELLNERIEELDNIYNELDTIDCSYDEEDEGWNKEEWINERLEEIQEVSFNL